MSAKVSLKRVAWAFATAREGSPEEARARSLLLLIIDQEREPGEVIVKAECPNCGVRVSVEYGDDEGEIGIRTEYNE